MFMVFDNEGNVYIYSREQVIVNEVDKYKLKLKGCFNLGHKVKKAI